MEHQQKKELLVRKIKLTSMFIRDHLRDSVVIRDAVPRNLGKSSEDVLRKALVALKRDAGALELFAQALQQKYPHLSAQVSAVCRLNQELFGHPAVEPADLYHTLFEHLLRTAHMQLCILLGPRSDAIALIGDVWENVIADATVLDFEAPGLSFETLSAAELGP
jgi:hypothetical protein